MRLFIGLGLLVAQLLAAAPAAKPLVDDLGWLAGAWVLELDGRSVREEWMAPAGGAMLGMSRTVQAGRLVDHEFVLLQADAAGEIHYTVRRPSGELVAFRLVHLAANTVRFENPAHDFPRRIGYALQADGSLLAYIEGEINGQTRRIDFPYRRAE